MGVNEDLALIMQLARMGRQGQKQTSDPGLIDLERAQGIQRTQAEQALVQPLDPGLSDSARFLTRQGQIRQADPEKVDERIGREALGAFGQGPSQRTQLKFQLIDAGIMKPSALDDTEKVMHKRMQDERLRVEETETAAQRAARELGEAQTQRDIRTTQREARVLDVADRVSTFDDLMNPEIVPEGFRTDVAEARGWRKELEAREQRERDLRDRAEEQGRFGYFADPKAEAAVNQLQDVIVRQTKRLEPGGDPLIWETVTSKERDARISRGLNKAAEFRPVTTMGQAAQGEILFAVRYPDTDDDVARIKERIRRADKHIQYLYETGRSPEAYEAEQAASREAKQRELEELETRQGELDSLIIPRLQNVGP